MEKLTYTVKEMAEAVGVSLPTAYEMIHIHDFPVIRVGRKVIIPIASLKLWLERRAAGQEG